MANAVVKFKTAGRGHTVDGTGLGLQVGHVVVVDTDTGLGIGDVIRLLPPGGPKAGASPRKVIRLADESDLQRRRSLEEREIEARKFVLERIRERGLEMKLVATEFAFDMSHLDIYFSSEERIDFRNLQKDCSNQFHMRTEFKQIGARDAAKLIGGIGPCGRELCCSTWLQGFASVNVKTVKLQNLSLNPTNIAGVCGKLKCCLNYEADLYTEILKDLPKSGKRVLTELGEGRVTNHNIFRRTVFVRIPEIGEVEFEPDQVILASLAAADPNALPWLKKPRAQEPDADEDRPPAAVARPAEPEPEETDEEDDLELEKIGSKLSESEAHFGAFMARTDQQGRDRDKRRDPRQSDPRTKAMDASGVARPQPPQPQRPPQGQGGGQRPQQGRDGRPQGGRDGRPQGQAQQQSQQQRPPRPPQQARPAQQQPTQPRPEGQPGAEGERKEGQDPGSRRRRRRGRGGRGGGGGGGGGSPQGGGSA